MVVALDEGQRAMVESELSKYDFAAINGKGSSNDGRFDTGCALFSPGFLGGRIMAAVDALATDMTTDMEAVIMEGNSININAPELDTLLRLRADSSQAKKLGELFSSRKKIPLKQLRVSEEIATLGSK